MLSWFQGCPLSPILFALIIELLANVIRKDNLIKVIGFKDIIKTSVFADDHY